MAMSQCEDCLDAVSDFLVETNGEKHCTGRLGGGREEEGGERGREGGREEGERKEERGERMERGRKKRPSTHCLHI